MTESLRVPSASLTGSGLTALGAVEVVAALRHGQFTAEEYVGACLARIAEVEPVVQAWVVVDRDYVLARAREADEWRRSGGPLGPLHGLPVGVKDIIDTADLPTQHGSPLFKSNQPRRDAACVARLRADGAIVMGKTVTTELARFTPGKTANPHNPEHTPGGSSSGSAAAVASGMVPVALGTQTGGSVIRPGSFCGVFAIKPTFGLIGVSGVLPQSHTLDTVGVYGRSESDLALLMRSLVRSDDEPESGASRQFVRSMSREADSASLSLAFFRTPAWPEIEQVAGQAFEELVRRLRLSELRIPELDDAPQNCVTVGFAESAHHYARLMNVDPAGISQRLRDELIAGARIAAVDYLRALRSRDGAYAAFESALGSCDALVVPASAGPAPRSLASTGTGAFNNMWTFLGTPCVTVPVLEVDGMPYGVQLVARHGHEHSLLRAVSWLRDQIEWMT